MNGTRLLSVLALTGALLQSAGSHAQPPGARPGVAPQPAAEPLPVVPKSAGAFITVKVSDLFQHADLNATTWGLRTSNLSEIVNSSILQARCLPPYAFMCVTTRMLSGLAWEASQEAARLGNEGHSLTPYALRLCLKVKESAAGLHASSTQQDNSYC